MVSNSAKKEAKELNNIFGSVPHSFLRTYINNKSGKTLLPRFVILSHNTQLYYSMEISGSRHHGGVHHLPIGLYYGNRALNQSFKMGCRRGTTTVWSVVTTDTSLYGRYNNTYNNSPLH